LKKLDTQFFLKLSFEYSSLNSRKLYQLSTYLRRLGEEHLPTWPESLTRPQELLGTSH